MRLTEEIDLIEHRMLEEREADRIACAVVACACFVGLALCWLIALVMP